MLLQAVYKRLPLCCMGFANIHYELHIDFLPVLPCVLLDWFGVVSGGPRNTALMMPSITFSLLLRRRRVRKRWKSQEMASLVEEMDAREWMDTWSFPPPSPLLSQSGADCSCGGGGGKAHGKEHAKVHGPLYRVALWKDLTETQTHTAIIFVWQHAPTTPAGLAGLAHSHIHLHHVGS